jgi:hypothetical protein
MGYRNRLFTALDEAQRAIEAARRGAQAHNDQRCWEALVEALGHVQGGMSDLLDNGWPKSRE